ncbi:NAD-dependent epimerase/dehydratase family protein [Shimia sp. R9_2]|uniref:NAD-dependent epimerase/dehydratase family protein n=1 Tax=Shimia sp. R9_2 TaxID=2821112 RepID=UPI001ADBCDD6|nr:NAD-dependent epimerase/dehydratase family protein [Shimia sp. R9_2]MBO9395355.1 NAD-dependent epimerase/dehydratase family protein [Shimia sp. R9_2]
MPFCDIDAIAHRATFQGLILTSIYSPISPNLADQKTLLILGSTGKLARLMRYSLQLAPTLLNDWKPIWCGRDLAADLDLVVTSETRAFPTADAVLALWGVVPSSGDLSQNTNLARRANEIASLCGATHIMHCSSSAVYGPGQALSEISKPAPANDYGAAKVAMEEAALTIHRNSNSSKKSTIFRLANVVGADSLFEALNGGGTLKLDRFPNGMSPLRSYATPKLVWAAIDAVISAENPPDIVNVAASKPVAMHDLLRAANHTFDWQDAPESAVAEVSLDVSLLQQLTGSDLHVTAAQMIEEWRSTRKALV